MDLRGKGKLPGLLVPCRFEARFKPLRFPATRAERELGWTPPLSYEECLERTYGPVVKPSEPRPELTDPGRLSAAPVTPPEPAGPGSRGGVMTRGARSGCRHVLLALLALAACDCNSSADSGHGPRPAVAAAAGPVFTAPPGSMPLLSRAVPATASSGHAGWAQDAIFAAFAPDHMWTCMGDCWLTYDLSAVPERQRSSLLVALFFGGNVQYQLNVHALGGVDLRGLPPAGTVSRARPRGTGPGRRW